MTVLVTELVGVSRGSKVEFNYHGEARVGIVEACVHPFGYHDGWICLEHNVPESDIPAFKNFSLRKISNFRAV